MARVVILGAGAMGLAAAYHAAKAGHQVDVLEAAPDPGGMAGHFDFDGLSIERYYHFVCRGDRFTFSLLEELGIGHRLRWRPTSMGFFYRNELHPWGDPLALARFPGLGPIDKLRYALFAFASVRRNRWPSLEQQSARKWIRSWCGATTYERCWKPLFEFKFYEYADDISAAWMWTRIRRVGRSRKSMFQEELGYIEGGTITLIHALIEAMERHGGRLHLRQPARRITTEAGRVTGVLADTHFPADAVISTVPTPLVSSLAPDLPDDWKSRYNSIPNIAVVCVVFKLARPVSRHFWINISDPEIAIPGIVEFSNLRDLGKDAIVYLPFYMPASNPKFAWCDERFIDESFACLRRIQPDLTREDIRAARVARLRYGQPICSPGFSSLLPAVQTPIAGLQIADTCFYYPEDRGISESVRLGAEMAASLGFAARAGDAAFKPLQDATVPASPLAS